MASWIEVIVFLRHVFEKLLKFCGDWTEIFALQNATVVHNYLSFLPQI